MRGLNLQDSVQNMSGPDEPGTAQIRLQRYMAECGVASRRACEKIILSSRVSVNGSVVSVLGTKVSPNDIVTVDGRTIKLEEQKRYVLLNKPSGYVCTSSDEKNRPRALDLLKEYYKERLYSVGRLDMYSEGLIIFTNDGVFASKLAHPSSEIEKEYIISTALPVPDALVTDFRKGVRIEGVFYRCKSCKLYNSHKLQVVLLEGKNREIRRVFEHFGIGIKRLERVRIGSVSRGDLSWGHFRDLTPHEVKNLLDLCGINS